MINFNTHWVIHNEQAMDKIMMATGMAEEMLQDVAAMAAADHMTSTEQGLAEFAGKVHVTLVHLGRGNYTIKYQIRGEPDARRVGTKVFTSKPSMNQEGFGHDATGKKEFRKVRESRAVTEFAGKRLSVASDTATSQVSLNSAAMAESRMRQIYERHGIKVRGSGSVFRAPRGGVRIGSSYYKGGSTVPAPNEVVGEFF